MTQTDDYLDSKMLYCAFTTATDQKEEARVSLMKASPHSSSICNSIHHVCTFEILHLYNLQVHVVNNFVTSVLLSFREFSILIRFCLRSSSLVLNSRLFSICYLFIKKSTKTM